MASSMTSASAKQTDSYPPSGGAARAASNSNKVEKTAADAEVDPRFTHFNFTGKVFQAPGAKFCLSKIYETPVFCVDLGDNDATLDVVALQKGFDIEAGSSDDKLIALAVKGLQFVPSIKPGDRIPSEILDGTASWRIEERHIQIAMQRLKAQLLSWVSGQEILITDPEELESYFGQIENKEKIKVAFSNAAEMLGYDRENHAVVLEKIDSLGRELCYIEALRDAYKSITLIAVRIGDIQKLSKSDRRMADEIQRVKLLLRRGMEEYTKIFEEIDAQTGEIVSALKSVSRQVDYIRQVRDKLHFLMMSWDPIIKQWQEAESDQPHHVKLVISETYRFLARKFNTARSMMQ